MLAGKETERLEAARAVAQVLDREAAQGRDEAKLTDAAVEALLGTGVFMACAPKEFGGEELRVTEYLQVLEELSRADAPAGWATMAVASHAGLFGSYFSDEGVARLFDADSPLSDGDGPPLIAGMPAARGRADRVDGGYMFAGKHQFASGASFSRGFTAGAKVFEDGEPVLNDDGTPYTIAIVVPDEQVLRKGNWRVNGMEATASIDYEIPLTFVPDDMVIPFSPWPDRPHRGANWWAIGMQAIAPSAHTAVVLGLSRRALEEVAAIAPTRKRPDAPYPAVSDQPLFQHELTLLEGELSASRMYFFALLDAAEEAVEGVGGPAPRELSDRIVQMARVIHDVGLRCVDFAYAWSGSVALRQGHVIGRLFSNMHAINNHVVLDRNIVFDAAPTILESLATGAAEFRE